MAGSSGHKRSREAAAPVAPHAKRGLFTDAGSGAGEACPARAAPFAPSGPPADSPKILPRTAALAPPQAQQLAALQAELEAVKARSAANERALLQQLKAEKARQQGAVRAVLDVRCVRPAAPACLLP